MADGEVKQKSRLDNVGPEGHSESEGFILCAMGNPETDLTMKLWGVPCIL